MSNILRKAVNPLSFKPISYPHFAQQARAKGFENPLRASVVRLCPAGTIEEGRDVLFKVAPCAFVFSPK